MNKTSYLLSNERPVVVVTGALGFIGTHLSLELINRGFFVISIDNGSTASSLSDRLKEKTADFSNINIDVRDLNIEHISDCQRERRLGEVVGVLHLACPAAPAHYSKDPVQTLVTCSQGTQRALDVAVHFSARFLLASTSEVYGDPQKHPQREDYWGNVNPVGPRSMYDEGKRYAESLVRAYEHKAPGLFTIARIFNSYGPGMNVNDGRLVPNIITQCLEGRPITVYGDGLQTRSLCFVHDTVQGLIKLWQSSHPGPMNIGSENEQTVLAISLKIRDLLDASSTIVYAGLPKDDPAQRCPDVSLAAEKLSWKASVSFDNGIAETISYFKNSLVLTPSSMV